MKFGHPLLESMRITHLYCLENNKFTLEVLGSKQKCGANGLKSKTTDTSGPIRTFIVGTDAALLAAKQAVFCTYLIS